MDALVESPISNFSESHSSLDGRGSTSSTSSSRGTISSSSSNVVISVKPNTTGIANANVAAEAMTIPSPKDLGSSQAVQTDNCNDTSRTSENYSNGMCLCGFDSQESQLMHFRPCRADTRRRGPPRSLGVDGCFDGTCLVHMGDGGYKFARNLQKGDRVCCGNNGETAEVKCVMVMDVVGGQLTVVQLPSGLTTTPMHPIQWEGTWLLPYYVGDCVVVESTQVFNFVLDQHHTIVANSIACSVLGHQREGDTQHPFWGSWDRVVGCLREVDEGGFQHGLVKIAGTVRKKDSGFVHGFRSVDGREVIARDIEPAGKPDCGLSKHQQGRDKIQPEPVAVLSSQ